MARACVFSAIAWIGGCSVEALDLDADTDGGPHGKADGANDALSCPASVALNSAQGSAKRCIDRVTGRFVSTQCCADLCAGAGWREQANGIVCAWLGEPGLEGATQGQFAPSLCCDLQDDLACGRAQSNAGACMDPQSGRIVDDACCEPSTTQCHPVVRSGIASCTFEQMVSFADDPESLVPTLPELFRLCTSEGDIIAPEIDASCALQPSLPFCGLDFGQVDAQFIEPCRIELADEFDCTFGLQVPDLFEQFHLQVISRRTLRLPDAQAADALTREQIVAAARRAAFDEVSDLVDAFSGFDGGTIERVEIFDLSSNRAFTMWEFGAGDNGFGAIFDAGSTAVVTNIRDSFLEDPDRPASVGCGVPLGSGGTPCGGEQTCAAGFRCEGAIDHPIFGRLGRCSDPTLGSGHAGNDCFEQGACGPGAYCAGWEFEFGLCTPAWMFGDHDDRVGVTVTDGGTGEADLFVHGGASVPIDLHLDMELFHAQDVSQLRVTLVAPLRDEGTISVPFDGATAGLPLGTRAHTLHLRPAYPGDEPINGRWTIVVEDRAGGGGGGVSSWGLTYNSRFD
jgi:hypothetical protein